MVIVMTHDDVISRTSVCADTNECLVTFDVYNVDLDVLYSKVLFPNQIRKDSSAALELSTTVLYSTVVLVLPRRTN